MKEKKEYYQVNEICKLKNMTARNVRAIIAKLDIDKSDYSYASYRVQTLDYSPCGK